MTRNLRKPRAATIDDNEKAYIGASDRLAQGLPSPIPGGRTHIENYPTIRQEVPRPEPKPEYRGVMEHGVPAHSFTTHERSEMEQGPNDLKAPAPVPVEREKEYQTPVPVQIVENSAKIIKTLAADKFTVPANTIQGIRIAGRDLNRSHILLLVETAAGSAGSAPTGIRIDHEISNLDVGGGALVRAGGTSYLKLDFQDELFAVSNDGSACTLSVIYLYGTPGA